MEKKIKREVEIIFNQIIHGVASVIKNKDTFERSIRRKRRVQTLVSTMVFLFFKERKCVKIKTTVPIAKR
jgi:hypothetical protein